MSDETAGATITEYKTHEIFHPHVNYWMIFVALSVLTGISCLADKMGDWGLLNKGVVLAGAVLAIACAKALCVMLYFMHLKFEGNWKYVLLSPTIILAMAIIAALMPDIGSHYYDYDVPQTMHSDEEDAGHGGAAEHGTAPQAHE
jgi:cytochrome c oxidase subunit 4